MLDFGRTFQILQLFHCTAKTKVIGCRFLVWPSRGVQVVVALYTFHNLVVCSVLDLRDGVDAMESYLHAEETSKDAN